MEFLITTFKVFGLTAGIMFFSIIIWAFVSVTIDKITYKKRKEKASEFLDAIMGEVIGELIKEAEENSKKTAKKPSKKTKED